MFKINTNLIEREMKYDNTVVLKYHIEYPSIVIPNNRNGERKFNTYNEKLALALQKKSENELYKESVELYKYNKSNNYPIMVYDIYRNYNVTFNSKALVSLYFDEYIFSGGANGNTTRTSQTWDFNYNYMLQLYEFFYKDPYFLIDILKKINNQISNNPNNYFPDSCNLVLETFNPLNYYLTPQGIAIYFQQYDIAPHSSGIPTFIV